MTDSTAGGATVDVAHYSFRRACYRGGNSLSWGVFSSSPRVYEIAIGRQLMAVVFWQTYVQIIIYRNNTSAAQTVTVRGDSFVYQDIVSDKYYISAVTFAEDEVFNPLFVNFLENFGWDDPLPKDYVEEYLDYCQIRRMYELSSPVASTATVTEIRIPYSYLSWYLMDVDHNIYNADGSLKDGRYSQNYMFSDFENK